MPPRVLLAALVCAALCAVAHAGAFADIQALKDRYDADSPFNGDYVAASPLSFLEAAAEVEGTVYCTDEVGRRRQCAHQNGVCCPNKGYCCPEGHRCVLSAMKTNHCKRGRTESSVPASRTSESSKKRRRRRSESSVSLPLSSSVESSFSKLGSGWKSLSGSILPSLSSLSESAKPRRSSSGSRKSRSGSRKGSKGKSGSSSGGSSNTGRPRSINVVNHIILNTTPNPVVASGGSTVAKPPSAAPKFKAVNPDTVSNSNTLPLAAPAGPARSVSGVTRGVPKVK